MESYATLPVRTGPVQAIDRRHHGIDRVVTLEVVPEYVHADFLVGRPEGLDRSLNR